MNNKNTLLKNFQVKGFLNLKFEKNKTYDYFKNVIEDIHNGKLKKGWNLKQKYFGTKDLRPNVVDYDDVFLEILLENDISKKINFITQRKLDLAHIQIRVSEEGESYMPWHRDTYSYNESSHGNLPPVIKLIYYLPEKQTPLTKLQIIKGSHVCMANTMSIQNQLSPGFDIFDRDICLRNLPCYNFKNSDLEYVIFDTSCLHNVVNSNKSTRIIYTFCTEYQFYENFCNDKNENSNIHLSAFDKFRKINKI